MGQCLPPFLHLSLGQQEPWGALHVRSGCCPRMQGGVPACLPACEQLLVRGWPSAVPSAESGPTLRGVGREQGQRDNCGPWPEPILLQNTPPPRDPSCAATPAHLPPGDRGAGCGVPSHRPGWCCPHGALSHLWFRVHGLCLPVSKALRCQRASCSSLLSVDKCLRSCQSLG